MDHKNIKLDLSPEEQKVFEKVREQIKDKLKDNLKNKPLDPNIDLSGLLHDPNILVDDPIHPRHISTYPREIYVELRMEMSAVNDMGQFTEISQILESFYHIPVPSGVDYLCQISGFIDKFDSSLLDCAKKIHKKDGIKEVHI
jgi:hypothetical protein